MESMGSTAIASGEPPKGSLHDPTIVPPCFWTRVTTSRMGSAEISSLQSSASSPLVFGFALRDARLRFAAVFEGIPLSLIQYRLSRGLLRCEPVALGSGCAKRANREPARAKPQEKVRVLAGSVKSWNPHPARSEEHTS